MSHSHNHLILSCEGKWWPDKCGRRKLWCHSEWPLTLYIKMFTSLFYFVRVLWNSVFKCLSYHKKKLVNRSHWLWPLTANHQNLSLKEWLWQNWRNFLKVFQKDHSDRTRADETTWTQDDSGRGYHRSGSMKAFLLQYIWPDPFSNTNNKNSNTNIAKENFASYSVSMDVDSMQTLFSAYFKRKNERGAKTQ